MMRRFWKYLSHSDVPLRTPTCRVKAWAHDDGFTIFWVLLWTLLLLALCH